eukprot:g69471.t1
MAWFLQPFGAYFEEHILNTHKPSMSSTWSKPARWTLTLTARSAGKYAAFSKRSRKSHMHQRCSRRSPLNHACQAFWLTPNQPQGIYSPGSCAERYRHFTHRALNRLLAHARCTCSASLPTAAARAAVRSMRDRVFADNWDDAVALGCVDAREFWDLENMDVDGDSDNDFDEFGGSGVPTAGDTLVLPVAIGWAVYRVLSDSKRNSSAQERQQGERLHEEQQKEPLHEEQRAQQPRLDKSATIAKNGKLASSVMEEGFDLVHRGRLTELMDWVKIYGANATDRSESGTTLLHCAAVFGQDELAQALLAQHAAVDQPDGNSLTALMLACNEGWSLTVQVLLAHGASVRAQNADSYVKLSGIPLYSPGGRTGLHFAAEQGHLEVVQLLLACPDIQADLPDNDGMTPQDLALCHDNLDEAQAIHRSLRGSDAEELAGWTDEKRRQVRKTAYDCCRDRISRAQDTVTEYVTQYVDLLRPTKAQTKQPKSVPEEPTVPAAQEHFTSKQDKKDNLNSEKVKKDNLKEAETGAVQQYCKKHAHVYSFQDWCFEPSFLSLVRKLREQAQGAGHTAQELAQGEAKELGQAAEDCSRSSSQLVRKHFTELCPGVYAGKFLSQEYCADLMEELAHYTAEASKPGATLPIRRPNSMNSYGLVLNDLGFRAPVFYLLDNYLQAVFDALYPAALTQELNDHHTFLIQYEPGEDADLASHVDSSLITINVCLGKDFTGGQLYFHGLKGSTQSANDPYETPHPQAPEGCKHCIALYTHQPGFAVIHLGRQIHGANRITSGLRSNVVIWYRKQ